MIAPATIAMIAVVGFPLGRLLVNSFQDFGLRALFESGLHFVGFRNYEALFADPDFGTVVIRSVLFTASLVAVTILIGALLAELMTRISKPVQTMITVVMVAAWAVPTVAATVVWNWLFEPLYGLADVILTKFGVFGDWTSFAWFHHQTSAFLAIGALIVWQAVPFIMLTLYAAQSQIPAEYYEAAVLDGAGGWARWRSVTFPFIRQVLALVTIMSIIWDFTAFNQIWILTQGGPDGQTRTVGIWNYLLAFANNNFGEASALAVIVLLFLMAVSSLYIRVLVRKEEP